MKINISDAFQEEHPTTKLLKSDFLIITSLVTLKYAIINHIQKNIFLQKVFLFLQLAELTALIQLAKIIRGTPFMKNENSNTGIYDRFLVVLEFIQPRYIFVNKLNPVLTKELIKIDKNLKECSLNSCSQKTNFESLQLDEI